MVAQLQLLARTRAGLLARIWQRIQNDDCIDLAAQISFYFSLSLLPFCLVLAVIVGWLPSTLLWKSFAAWIVTYLPRQSQHLIFSAILGLVNDSTGFLSLGLVTAIWSASSGFVSLMESLSVVYAGRDTRSYWRKHAIAVCVSLLAMAFALVSFGLIAVGHWSAALSPAALHRSNFVRTLWGIGRWLFTFCVMILGVDFANYFLPDIRRPWRWISPGSAFVVVTLIASLAGFNVYIQHFSSYPRIYGALGGFIILMLWIYIASLILLIGAETDQEVDRTHTPEGQK